MGATAFLAVSAIGTGISAISQIKAGNEQQRIANINARSIGDTTETNADLIEEGAAANADVLEFNARMNEANARDAEIRGYTDESKYRIGVRSAIGSQRAGYASQGVDVNSGSALEVQMDSAYQGELDALQIRANAARESWGYQNEAENYRQQKSALLKNARLQASSVRRTGTSQQLSTILGGDAAARAGKYGAVGSVLNTTAQVLGTYYGRKK